MTKVKELPRIEYKGEDYVVDGRLGEIRNVRNFETISFEDLEDMIFLDLLLSKEDTRLEMLKHSW